MSYEVTNYNFTDDGENQTLTFKSLTSTDIRKDSTAPAPSDGVQEAYVNNTSDFGCVEKIRIRRTQRTNVYQKTGIDRAFWAPTTRGVQINWLIDQIWEVTDNDPDNPKPSYKVPAKASLTLTVAEDAAITATDILELIQRLLATVYTDGTSHLSEAFKGAISLK